MFEDFEICFSFPINSELISQNLSFTQNFGSEHQAIGSYVELGPSWLVML